MGAGSGAYLHDSEVRFYTLSLAKPSLTLDYSMAGQIIPVDQGVL